MGRQKRVGRMTGTGKETGRRHRRRKRGGAKLVPSPLRRRRERELPLHLGPEGAPWGQPSEMRALPKGTMPFRERADENVNFDLI